MQYTTIFLAALSAASTLAAPLSTRQNTDNFITIQLNGRSELSKQSTLKGHATKRQEIFPSTTDQFDSINIRLGKAVAAQNQDLRCQAIDDKNQPITGQRGANIDTNFSDGGLGATWNFLPLGTLYTVKKIVCDPSFKKTIATREANAQVNPADIVTVQFSGLSEEASQTPLEGDSTKRQEVPALNTKTKFDQVTINLGANVDPTLRCKILDFEGQPIVAKRGTNTDFTFADGDKGAWTFVDGLQTVTKVICDPAFKSLN